MRRIISVCLLQTMRFDTAREARPEQDLEVFLNIKKQYHSYNTAGYLQ